MDICEIGNGVNAHFFYKFPDDKFSLRMTNGGLTIKVSSKPYEKNVGAKRGNCAEAKFAERMPRNRLMNR